MLMVNALAGTGKTTVGLWGLGERVPKNIKVSAEQKAIIKVMRTFDGPKAACAFNTSIANELKNRSTVGIECATANAFGHRAWARHKGERIVVDPLKSRKICRELLGQRFDWRERMKIETAVHHIVSLCKSYLFDPCTSERENWIEAGVEMDGVEIIGWLCGRFDIEHSDVIAEYAQKTFKKSVESTGFIDFNDQIFLPLYHDIQLPQYGHLLVDECQDLPRAKQSLMFAMADNITAIGDINQAIYGFSGADSEAMLNMWEDMVSENGDASKLPLTITRRCPKSVVRLTNRIVPSLKAMDDAIEGNVHRIMDGEFHKTLGKELSMIMCRINAPLMSLAFKLISQNIRCYIQGREIGSGLKSELKRTGDNSLAAAISKCGARIEKKKMEILLSPFPDENQIDALSDKMNCISILSEDVDTIEQFSSKVDSLFKDSGGPNDIRLSSVHKAKGLEHKNVIIYKSELLGRKSKLPYQTQQEKNLEYVAYTRSMENLTLVKSEKQFTSSQT